MAVGLEVRNEEGVIQIDGSTPNLVFRGKGVANGSVAISGVTQPLVFIRPSAGRNIYMQRRDLGGGQFHHVYFCTGDFAYWVFGESSLTTNNRYGLQIFSADCKLVYQSEDQPLRIPHVLSYTRQIPSGITEGATVADLTNALPHDQFAYMPVNFGATRYIVASNGNAVRFMGEVLQTTSRGFRVFQTLLPNSSQGRPSGSADLWLGVSDPPPPSVVCADVSGL
jgi:hypothetical protein